MMILDIWQDTLDFFEPIVTFFKNIWNDINTFLLQYMSQDVLNIFVFGILIAIILFVILAVMNRK